MPEPRSFDYAILRVVPHVERGECLNVGVALFSRTARFLKLSLALDRRRLAALAPNFDVEALEEELAHIAQILQGDPEAGPIATLPPSERFHWLVAPRSTVIQTSPVHTGLTTDPEAMLDHLLRTLVLLPAQSPSGDPA